MDKHRALVTVDAEQFSAHPGALQPDLHMAIRRTVAEACGRAGLADAWGAARFLQSTGDGLLAVLPAETLPALVDRFPRALQDALDEAAPGLRAAGVRLRLRVALHVGLVDDERDEAPGIATVTNEVCRLVDSKPVRDALNDSDPDVTYTAALLSEEVFRTYVADGHTRLRPSQLTEVKVEVKQFRRNAYLWVPTPSRRPDGETPPAGDAPSTPPSDPPYTPPAGTVINGVTISGQATRNQIGNTFHGPTTFGDVRTGSS
ncbi:hypothetical protein [Actinocorallia sp. A-T 12471]|uniref:hypothetical protein n=1 Tax=Actinocorallia sp. A-T 12471 TaxID=3089813 RepID=UPI0029D405F7|nr:hypothetical protein [Actinocorallia sp. A-T 12471]MDX6742812.1 hypothetical protein [Actinocorallia sp. A-T 12471]